MKFTKMHGLGNDYVVVNCFDESVEAPSELARRINPRRTGVGSDGLILILPSAKADFRMRIFNVDGSEAEMCGNGIRCVGKYVYEKRLTDRSEIAVETLSGIRRLKLDVADDVVEAVEVDMGCPVLERNEIPMRGAPGRVVDETLQAGSETFKITAVSMGNPHCVIFTDDVDTVALDVHGPAIENHVVFPNRVNVEFAQVISPEEIKMRTWERGCGETFACGTGANAVCAAAVLNKLTERAVTVHLRGGDLNVRWSDDGPVFMKGPASTVFEGDYAI